MNKGELEVHFEIGDESNNFECKAYTVDSEGNIRHLDPDSMVCSSDPNFDEKFGKILDSSFTRKNRNKNLLNL